MSKVAKLTIIDNDDNYLMLYRSGHPHFGNDPDLPGGTLEDGEQPVETMVREVQEEAGIDIDASAAQLVYEGMDYSAHETQYSLYTIQLTNRPEVLLSWEHSSYEWIARDDFLNKAKHSVDTYMHMVYDVLK